MLAYFDNRTPTSQLTSARFKDELQSWILKMLGFIYLGLCLGHRGMLIWISFVSLSILICQHQRIQFLSPRKWQGYLKVLDYRCLPSSFSSPLIQYFHALWDDVIFVSMQEFCVAKTLSSSFLSNSAKGPHLDCMSVILFKGWVARMLSACFRLKLITSRSGQPSLMIVSCLKSIKGQLEF